MPKCLYCGQYAGLFTDRHGACEAGEKTTSANLGTSDSPVVATPHPLTFRMIA
jgi:hypothetical protein